MPSNVGVPFSSQSLRSKAVQSGTESCVKVNQRNLIDKILARYSSDFVVFRELIQNADDVRATSFHLAISCHQPDSSRRHHKSAIDLRHARNGAWSGLEQRLRAPRKRTEGSFKPSTHYPAGDLQSDGDFSELDFHNCAVTELRALNNGHPFSNVDWERVAAIADGNIDVDSVGQFGVGFFSVFSYSNEPIITSGKEYLVFAWRDDNTLTTYRQKLPAEHRSQWTSILINMRNQFVLLTNSTEDDQSEPKSLKMKKKKNRSTPLDDIIPTIDLQQLKIFFTRVLLFTKHIKELMISINDVIVFQVNKSMCIVSPSKKYAQFKQQAMHPMFQLGSFVHSQQTISTANGTSLTLNHVAVDVKVAINEDFHQKIEHSLKKRLPPSIAIQILYASDSSLKQLQRLHTTSDENSEVDVDTRIIHSLIPLKFENGSLAPDGVVFIGFATHQTTGIGVHIHSHLIPTIERESLDLQDPHIAVWNRELLAVIGQIVRFIYDRTMLDGIQLMTGSSFTATLFAPFTFQTTSPDPQIGNALFEGFFASNSAIQVPVQKAPLQSYLSLIPSSEAFLSNSASLHEFLDLPLVPFELAQCEFFTMLKKTGLIAEINKEIVFQALLKSALLFNELLTLLHWLRKEHSNDNDYIKRVFSIVRFHERLNSPLIDLKRIKYYDTFNIPKHLPLPPGILPISIASHFSMEDLHFTFSLTKCTLKHYLGFYLSDGQSNLFREAHTSEELLRFISKYSSQLTDAYWTTIKEKLAQIRCISTNHGMKFPSESYLPSSLSTDDQPMVSFKLSHVSADVNQRDLIDDDSIPVAFLKRIGCRIISKSLFAARQQKTLLTLPETSSEENMKVMILSLIEERANLAEADIQSLKETRFLAGTTLNSPKRAIRTYAAHELHFPSVAVQLKWSSLLIIDWFDIDPHSAEYAFLKEIGVHEVPDLSKVLDRIIQSQNTSTDNYKIPIELTFFAEHFQTDYCSLVNLNKCQRAFLPSVWPSQSNIVLLPPADTFTDVSPLCPMLVPEVTRLFRSNFRIELLGIKDKPTLTQAFELLMETKDERLKTIHRANTMFSYFNELEGRNAMFIERVAQIPFIPLFEDHGQLVKPTEVFIRSSSLAAPSAKNPDDENIDTRGLIDFVDFGSSANSFLLSVGVRHYPSATMLANLLIDRQATYFKDSINNPDESAKKQKAYLYCLKQLAMSNGSSNELMMDSIKGQLQREPWCLGYQMLTTKSDGTERICKIVSPREIYLNDDHSLVLDLNPLCSPDEPLLADLYRKFGSQWLSDCAQRVTVHTGHTNVSDRSKELKVLILSRLEMLFVNSRGSQFPNLNKKQVELISRTLTVFETDGIKCQFRFEGKTLNIKTHWQNSCSLELENGLVNLYLLRDHPNIDYFQVASELAQFVLKKPIDTYFDSICNKLELPLETLKERGIPVDRLLKHVERAKDARVVQATSVVRSEPEPKRQPRRQSSPEPHQEASKKRRFGWLGIFHWPVLRKRPEFQRKSFSNEPEIVHSNTMIVPIKNFGQQRRTENSNMQNMIHGAQPYTEKELKSGARERIEDIHSCTITPPMHLVRFPTVFHSIPLYIEQDVSVNKQMSDAANQLARIINGLATEVFRIPVQTTHLFRDKDSAHIAFNSNGSIFFNLRYYEQVFEQELQQTNRSSSTMMKTVNFYYLTACHELSHNLYPAHDTQFISQMQSVAVEYMSAKDRYLQKMLMDCEHLSACF